MSPPLAVRVITQTPSRRAHDVTKTQRNFHCSQTIIHYLGRVNVITTSSRYFANTNLSKSSNVTFKFALSSFSFSALRPGKATPVVICVCPRRRSLSFSDCNPSSERQVSLLAGVPETFLGRFLGFYVIFLVSVANSVAAVAHTRFKNSGIL